MCRIAVLKQIFGSQRSNTTNKQNRQL